MVLRLTGYFFLCVAMAALAYDGMRTIADNGQLAFTSLEQHWQAISPDTLLSLQNGLLEMSPYLFSPMLMAIIALPSWIVAGVIGVLTYLAGYRPPRPSIPDGI
jgi:hypothetical protein